MSKFKGITNNEQGILNVEVLKEKKSHAKENKHHTGRTHWAAAMC